MRSAIIGNRFFVIYSILVLAASVARAEVAPPADPGAPVSTSALSAEASPPAAAASKKLNAYLKVGIAGETLEDRYVQGTMMGTDLIVGGTHEFAEQLKAKMELLGMFYASHASGVFDDEARPPSGFFLREAYLSYAPARPLDLRAGVLRTEFSTLPSLMMPKGFPGLSQTLSLGDTEGFLAQLTLRQLVPTDITLGLRSQTAPESTPSLLTGTFTLQGKPVGSLLLSGSVTYFRFADLSNGTAKDSRFLGNTTVQSGLAYVYRYEGAEASVGLEAPLGGGFSSGLRGAGIANFKAPDGANNGASLSAETDFEASGFKLGGDLGYYYNQSDTLPAAYTSIDLGNNNRMGLSAGLRLDLKRIPLSFYGRWIQADTIVQSSVQANRNVYILGTEASYVLF